MIAVGVERPLRRLAEERFPHDVFRRHIGTDGPRPLRFPVRRVAVHARLDHGDLAHQLRLEEAHGVGELAERGPLMPTCTVRPVGALIGGAHALGVIGIERHGLFLIDVLAGVERGGEAFGVQVLRRRDQHGVDAFIVQQMAVIEIGLGVGRDLLDLFEAVAYRRRPRPRIRHSASETACRRISDPRSPGPMMPMRMRSLAPGTALAALWRQRRPIRWRLCR